VSRNSRRRCGKVLRELGYVKGQNISVAYRWADSKSDRILALAEELVR
jgi:hypothetical protein